MATLLEGEQLCHLQFFSSFQWRSVIKGKNLPRRGGGGGGAILFFRNLPIRGGIRCPGKQIGSQNQNCLLAIRPNTIIHQDL